MGAACHLVGAGASKPSSPERTRNIPAKHIPCRTKALLFAPRTAQVSAAGRAAGDCANVPGPRRLPVLAALTLARRGWRFRRGGATLSGLRRHCLYGSWQPCLCQSFTKASRDS